MQSDLPHVLYNNKKKNDGEKPRGNTVASDKVIKLQEEANRKMRERKEAEARGGIQYDLEELYK